MSLAARHEKYCRFGLSLMRPILASPVRSIPVAARCAGAKNMGTPESTVLFPLCGHPGASVQRSPLLLGSSAWCDLGGQMGAGPSQRYWSTAPAIPKCPSSGTSLLYQHLSRAHTCRSRQYDLVHRSDLLLLHREVCVQDRQKQMTRVVRCG